MMDIIVIEKILKSPTTYFLYGCIYFSLGIVYWQSQIFMEHFFSINLPPLIGLFITGMFLLIGFVWIMSNYDEFINTLRKKTSQNKPCE